MSHPSRYHHRLALAKQTNAPVGAGAFLEGNILLVGEQASDPTTAPEQQPFCSDRGCSGWLNRLLDDEGIMEEQLFWVNALNNDGSSLDIAGLVSQLRPSAVITLGTVARKVCQEQRVEFIHSYHPQYWKRFRSKERYPLLSLIKFLSINVPVRNLG